MSFRATLERLRAAAEMRSRGLPEDCVIVSKCDLVELLRHFDRLDAIVRAEHALTGEQP